MPISQARPRALMRAESTVTAASSKPAGWNLRRCWTSCPARGPAASVTTADPPGAIPVTVYGPGNGLSSAMTVRATSCGPVEPGFHARIGDRLGMMPASAACFVFGGDGRRITTHLSPA